MPRPEGTSGLIQLARPIIMAIVMAATADIQARTPEVGTAVATAEGAIEAF